MRQRADPTAELWGAPFTSTVSAITSTASAITSTATTIASTIYTAAITATITAPVAAALTFTITATLTFTITAAIIVFTVSTGIKSGQIEPYYLRSRALVPPLCPPR